MTTTLQYRMPRPGTQQHQVFAALRSVDTSLSHAELVARTGLTGVQVSQAIFWLTRRGLVERLGSSQPFLFKLVVPS